MPRCARRAGARAGIDNPFDFDRNGRVEVIDQSIVRRNFGRTLDTILSASLAQTEVSRRTPPRRRSSLALLGD
jgi:hypothetical protein